jgi:peroxiredoxin
VTKETSVAASSTERRLVLVCPRYIRYLRPPTIPNDYSSTTTIPKLNFRVPEHTVTMREAYADRCREGTVGGRTRMDNEVSNGRLTPIEASAETLNGFCRLDIQTDRLLSSWLQEAGVPDGALKVNEPAPDFLLPEANGRLLSSLELRRTAPLIVTFVYGTWSPLCAAGLRALHGASPSIRAAGARTIAITPETGDLPRNFKRDYRLDLEVLSDLDLGVSLSFGLVSVVPAEIKSRLLQRGLDLSALNGFSFWMLPMPATYVLDQRGIIRRACVGPYSITGATTETVLAALSELDGPKPRP